MALGIANAATTQLSELITALDLSQTPDCSPAKGNTSRRARLISLSQSPVPPPPEAVHTLARNRLESLSLKPTPQGTSTAPSSLTPTSGRCAVGPAHGTPPSVARSSQRHSTQTFETTDGDVSVASYGCDSPLKNRGKQSRGTNSLLGKTSTGTMLNASGSNKTSPRGSVHSETTGNVTFPSQGDDDDFDDESDIPDELQDLLAGRAVRGVDDEAEVYDCSILGDASALMSDSLLESIVRPRASTIRAFTSAYSTFETFIWISVVGRPVGKPRLSVHPHPFAWFRPRIHYSSSRTTPEYHQCSRNLEGGRRRRGRVHRDRQGR